MSANVPVPVPRVNVSGTTRRSVKKSRGGCKRCKSQHLKCDELRPACSRCSRLGVQCPGYPPQSLKWSTKHELCRPGESLSQSPATPARPLRDFEFSVDDASPPPPVSAELDWTQLLFQPSLDAANQDHAEPSLFTPDAVNQDHTGPSLFTPDATNQDRTEPSLFTPDTGWNALQSLGAFPPWEVNVPTTPQSTALQKAQDRRPVQRRRQTMLHALQGQTMLHALQDQTVEIQPQLQASLTHQSSELIAYYFKEVPGVYSMYDNEKNPFRSAVSNLFSHSLVVNIAAQSMAAGFLVDLHPRLASIGRKLRREAFELIQKEPTNTSYNAMLALSMFGPTGNWIEASDLGVPFYKIMRDRVAAAQASGRCDDNLLFFDEALMFWEMNLAFVVEDDVIRPNSNATEQRMLMPSRKRKAHPWTGVAGEVIQLVSDIGRLVRAHRSRMRQQKFVSQACLDQLMRDLVIARDLERRILSYQSPDEASIVDLEDASTSIHHLTTLAEVYRYAGLLQLYRVFPDLLSDRLAAEDAAAAAAAAAASHRPATSHINAPPAKRGEAWLSAFAIEALRLLETVPLESGTRDFQPFLLVLCASELTCEGVGGNNNNNNMVHSSSSSPSTTSEDCMNSSFVEVVMVRKLVLDRLTTCLRLLPPKPIRVCIDIVKETWRRIDAGQSGVYWLDVMVEKGWETIMA